MRDSAHRYQRLTNQAKPLPIRASAERPNRPLPPSGHRPKNFIFFRMALPRHAAACTCKKHAPISLRAEVLIGHSTASKP